MASEQNCIWSIHPGQSDQFTDDEFKVYKTNQKRQIIETTVQFFYMGQTPVLEPCVFIPIQLSHIESHFEFYATKASEIRWRAAVQHHLQQSYNVYAEPMIEVELDFVCAVFDEGESTWYRGIVKLVDKLAESKRFHVLLMDFGRVLRAEQQHLAVLSEVFRTCKPLAFKCQLVTLHSDHRALIRGKALKSELRARLQVFVDQATLGLVYWSVAERPDKLQFYEVGLFIDARAENLFDDKYILHEVYAAFYRNRVQSSDPICRIWLNRPIDQWNYDETTFGERTRVIASHVVSSSEFYMQSIDGRRALIQDVRPQIDRYVNENIHRRYDERRWAIDDLCLVRAQNPGTKTILKVWLRGRIMAIADKMMSVFLRDIGSLATVDTENLLPVPLYLINGPDLAKKCYFVQCEGLQLNNSIDDIVRESLNAYSYYEMSVVESNKDALGISMRGINMQLNITDKPLDWCNIECRILSRATIVSMRQFNISNRSVFGKSGLNFSILRLIGEDNKELSSVSITFRNDRLLNIVGNWLPPSAVELRSFMGTITWLDTNGIFYIQNNKQASRCRSLSEEIGDYLRYNVRTLQRISYEHEWQVGDACVAIYCIDEQYYRAIVMHIDQDQCISTVQFVDYGQSGPCHLDKLRRVTQFDDIPALVNRFYIPEIVTTKPGDEWDHNIWKECSAWCVGKRCGVKVVDVADTVLNTVPCSITLDSIYGGNILQWMAKNGMFFTTTANSDDEIIFIV